MLDVEIDILGFEILESFMLVDVVAIIVDFAYVDLVED